MNRIENQLTEELAELKAGGSLRSLRALGRRSGKWIEFDGQRMLNLSSNDYMGYAADEKLVSEFYAEMSGENMMDDYGPGSSGSRLLSGNHPGYTRLEDSLEKLYGKPALVYSSGYHANIGVLSALAKRGDLILVDRLSHASLLDGIRLTNAEWQRYPHNDTTHLEELLKEKRSQYRRVFVVTESIFSMDGDAADLKALVNLKKEFDLVLYVDEAHAVGVRGKQGLGCAEEADVIPDIDIIVGTFGKALGGAGSFVVCADVVREYLINKSRSLIFTTALPPVTVNWNRWILEKIKIDTERRKHLSQISDRFRSQLFDTNITTRGNSHIIPAILGENQLAIDLAEQLNKDQFMVFAIRPPTVPPNTARLRFSLTASMDWNDLAGIFSVLKGIQHED